MEFSAEVMFLFQQAAARARQQRYEYITPEGILLEMLSIQLFREAFASCDGDIDILETNLQEYLENYVTGDGNQDPEVSESVNELLHFAGQSAYNSESGEIELTHLLHALWNLKECYAVYYMEAQGITEGVLLSTIAELEEEELDDRTDPEYIGTDGAEQDDGNWKQYAPCLNETLTDEKPLIGREAELERTIQILCRKEKNNPIHIGEPGVGKTAITHGLVRMLQDGIVPEPIKGAKVFALDLGGMLAGTQYRGDFEKTV